MTPSSPGETGRGVSVQMWRHVLAACAAMCYAGVMTNDSHLSLRLAKDQKEALERLAEGQDLSVGQLIRRAVKGLLDEAPPQRSAGPQVVPRRTSSRVDRSRELKWMGDNLETLRRMAGEWIVLQDETIVAHGPDYLEVRREARRRGVDVPFIYRIPNETEDTFYMGL